MVGEILENELETELDDKPGYIIMTIATKIPGTAVTVTVEILSLVKG